MYMFHIALTLGLIALSAGSALYVSAANCGNKGTCFAKLMAILVILFSIISLFCTLSCGIKAWKQNDSQCLMCPTQDKTQDKAMMGSNDSDNTTNNKKATNKTKKVS